MPLRALPNTIRAAVFGVFEDMARYHPRHDRARSAKSVTLGAGAHGARGLGRS
jgi:hypothetical protein